MSNFQDDDYLDDGTMGTWLVESGGIQITLRLLQLHDFSRVVVVLDSKLILVFKISADFAMTWLVKSGGVKRVVHDETLKNWQ